jgi:formylglycine-generating enzyme
MTVRRILAISLVGALSLSLPDGFTGATESQPTKPEFPSTASPKSEVLSIHAKLPSSNGDPRAGDKVKSLTNGGAAHHLAVPASVPSELVGKDGAPMVVVPAGEFIMGSDKGDEDEAPVHRVYVNAFYIDKFEVRRNHPE